MSAKPDFDVLFESLTGSDSRLPGVILAAFNKDGVYHSRAAGPRRADSTEEINLDSGFWGFSCTKLLTTICTLQCIDRGLIGLDDAVDSVLPELSNPQIISSDSAKISCFKLTPATQHITVRHLLTHTSGLSYDAMNPLLLAWRKSQSQPPLVMSGKVIEAYSLPVLFEPGSSWTYGCSLDWAGVLVGRLNGNVRLGEYMTKNIFEPLGIKNTTFHPLRQPDGGKYMAQMFSRDPRGELVAIKSPYPEDATEDSGGMGIATTPADFTKVLQHLLQDEPTLLRKETISLMFTPQFQLGSPQYDGLLAQRAMHAHLTGETSDAPNIAYGIGGLVILDGGVRNLPSGSLTWNGMPNIGWFVDRVGKQGAVYFSQLLPPADPESVSLMGKYWSYVHEQNTGKTD